jgi:hypothetical protein
MPLQQVNAGCPPYIHLTDIEAKLQCQRCGNRAGNRVLVTLADRD